MSVPAGQGQDRQAELMTLLSGGDPASLALAPSVDQRKPRDNKKKRMEAWQETYRLARREGLQTFYGALTTLSSIIGKVQLATLRTLSEADAETLMDEGLALKTLEEALQARKDQMRDIVFAVVTEQNTKLGVPDPENTSGSIVVKSRGKRFSKEGAGRGDSIIDWDALKEVLDDEQWKEVTEVKFRPAIPESTVVVGNREKLFDYVRLHPDTVSVIYPFVTEGEPKTAKYYIRDVDDNDDDGGAADLRERQ